MNSMSVTMQEILERIRREEIEMIDFKIVDIDGRFRHVTIPASGFDEEIMTSGIGFDASNYGYAVVEKSDMTYIPDLDTAMIDPFCQVKTLSMIGNAMIIDYPENRPLDQDGLRFNGKYYWDSQWDRYCLEISGSGSYADTTFTAVYLDCGDLIVNGGKVNYEYFTKTGANTDDIIKIIICIFIIGICAVIIIGFVRMNKADTTRTDSTDTSDSASSHKNKTHCKSEKEAISEPSQITIYYFKAKDQKYICPFCDGENSIEVKICSICGRDLNYKKQE